MYVGYLILKVDDSNRSQLSLSKHNLRTTT